MSNLKPGNWRRLLGGLELVVLAIPAVTAPPQMGARLCWPIDLYRRCTGFSVKRPVLARLKPKLKGSNPHRTRRSENARNLGS